MFFNANFTNWREFNSCVPEQFGNPVGILAARRVLAMAARVGRASAVQKLVSDGEKLVRDDEKDVQAGKKPVSDDEKQVSGGQKSV
jgi:hypothetical protein